MMIELDPVSTCRKILTLAVVFHVPYTLILIPYNTNKGGIFSYNISVKNVTDVKKGFHLGFVSKKLGIWANKPSTEGEANRGDIVLVGYILISVLILVLSYLFNAYYIKKHHQSQMKAEERTTDTKNMISFKSLILALFICAPMETAALVYQNSSGVKFPMGLFFPSLALVLVNFHFAKKQKFRDYFVRRMRQLEWHLPQLPSRKLRLSRVRVAPTQEMEMTSH